MQHGLRILIILTSIISPINTSDMDFARKQLEKYGWTDGKGLGKNENGISEPIKPKLKRSVAGIGHDQAAELTDQWWNKLYDKAAKNVEVEEKNGKTKKIKTKDDKFQITNSSYHLNKTDSNQDEEYSDFFIKKAVLTNGGCREEKVKESESDGEIEDDGKRDVFKMTDEELFAACEGRTAHKGARHGLRAIGKLTRIERQEQMLLKQPQYNGYSHAKKHKKDKKDASQIDLEKMETTNLSDEADSSKIKKKKKKRKRCFSDERIEASLVESVLQPVPEEIDTEKVGYDENPEINTKSKRKSDNSQNESEVAKPKKKKKQEQSEEAMETDLEEKVKKNKKKKNKREHDF